MAAISAGLHLLTAKCKSVKTAVHTHTAYASGHIVYQRILYACSSMQTSQIEMLGAHNNRD